MSCLVVKNKSKLIQINHTYKILKISREGFINMNKIKKKFSNLIIKIMGNYGSWVPDNMYLKLYSRVRTGKSLNLKAPKRYNEKINWMKLYYREPLMTKCADKYKVREHIKEKIGEEILVPLLWHGDDPREIPFDKLPKSFALKTNNASGTNIIVENKDNINKEEVIQQLDSWLKRDNYTPTREWVYKEIPPKIICEGFLEQEEGKELRDYRFFCFNGEPKFICIDFNINDKSKARRNLYSLDWELMEEEITYPKELNVEVEKPEKLKKMIEISKLLAEDFPHVRIDFYYINEKILFGEMTFYHQSGMGKFRPEKFDYKVGNWLTLPSRK